MLPRWAVHRAILSSVTYAGERRIIDADSHLMEWPTFLTDHAAASVRDRLPPIGGGRGALEVRRSDKAAAEVAALSALGDDIVRRGPKWYDALGATEGHERTAALDLLGFERQVVFSSLCAFLFNLEDAQLRYAAYRAHNRSMAGFCSADPRLIGVALCDLDDVDEALSVCEEAHRLGLGIIWLPARAPGGRAPGHHEHDRFWAWLAERRMPFVLHVGSGPLPIDPPWTNVGRAATEPMTGAEIINSKDLMVVHHPAVRFLSVLVLDGVLERHPTLHGGAIEMGAGWVPDMLRRMDHAVDIWSRSEPRLAAFERSPSQQAGEQLRFTPYQFEDVGKLVSEADPALFLFSSDYPHAEGGRDPIGRFSRTLEAAASPVRDQFFATNADGWLQ